MKTSILTFLIAALYVLFGLKSAMAIIAYPHPIDYQLPDGTHITIRMMGDERVKWAETIDGYSLLLNSDGFYEYAVKDTNGDMQKSGIRAKNITERSPEDLAFIAKLEKGLRFSPEQIGLMQQIWEIRNIEAGKAFPTTGNRKLICILIGFTDKAFVKTQTEFNNLFNQVGYTTGGATGSVKDYYLENSYSQFNLTVDVAGPYTASNTMAYYGANDVNGDDVRPRELAAEAVNLANPDVNYANYDNDNDGWVDAVYVIFAGYSEDAGGGANTIWSHAWYLISPLYLDGKYIQRYSCSPELRGNSGTTITSIGVICHEFGHVLGAPDYYDTNYATGGQYLGTGQWDLMGNGGWNNNGVTPAHHNGYTKVYYYNWASANTISTGQTITLQNAAQNTNSFYRYNTTTNNEFFFLENREKHLFDAYIPGSGMIIYHVHSNIATGFNNNTINATHPQMMYPVCQNATSDPTSNPSSYGSINLASCAWTGTGKTAFTDTSTPSSKSWAGANTNKPITNISRNATAKTVTFTFMGGSSGTPAISVNPGSLTQTLQTNQVATQTLTISNTGTAALNWQITVNTTAAALTPVLPENQGAENGVATSHERVDLSVQSEVEGIICPTVDRNATIRYDNGTRFTNIGLTNGGTFYAAAYFPAATMAQYAGMKLNQVHVFIETVPTSCVMKIYGPGTSTTPGTLLHEQAVSPTATSWNLITLTTPLNITGQDLWITFVYTHPAGVYVAGVDAGPPVTGFGDLYSSNGTSWVTLTSYGLNYNWNIAGYLIPGTTPWLSANPGSGTVSAGGSTQITVGFNSQGLTNGTYNGSLVITSNATSSPTVTVPVTLNVGGTTICYPAPKNLTSTVSGQTVTLNWQTPDLIPNNANNQVVGETEYQASINSQGSLNLVGNGLNSGIQFPYVNTGEFPANDYQSGTSPNSENISDYGDINASASSTQVSPGLVINRVVELNSNISAPHQSVNNLRAVLYDNGPIVNSPGTGTGGTDQSIMQSTTLSMSTLGFGAQLTSNNRLADNFVVPQAWNVESFTVFAYQTGSGTTSTMTGGYIQIWNGNPTQGGQIIWGDLTTNRLTASSFSNIYRVSQTSLTSTDRPVMSITIGTPGLVLQPGTYWVEFMLDGSLSSGPWVPPITINGQTTTGDALQYTGNTSSWQNLLDTGTNTQQGVPFIINGTASGGGCTHGELLGYKIYRNTQLIGQVSSSSLNFQESNVPAGTHTYDVTALYGQPYPGESQAISTNVTITPPQSLPFEETWASSNFTQNAWTFEPNQGNWDIEVLNGNPMPGAIFEWAPSTPAYSQSLVSKNIDASGAVGNVTLQFDIFLDNFANTGAEKMKIYIWNGTDWVLLDTFFNTSDIPWTTATYDVTSHALGKITKVRFEATGNTTYDIDFWLLDNIKLFQGQSATALTVTPASQNVTSAAGSTNFSVTSNTSWNVNENVSWLSVNPMSGTGNGTLTVSYDANTLTTPRTGEIVVTATGGTPSVTVTVTQAGAAPALTVTPANQNVTSAAGSTNFSLTSNTSWNVNENVSWLSVNPMSGTGNGTLTVSYDANTLTTPRTGEIVVTATGGTPSVTVTVTQAGAASTLTVTPLSQIVGPSSGTTSFSISSNTGWNVNEDVNWLTVNPMNGNGNGTITVNYDVNPTAETRVGQIVITTIDKRPSVTVTVNQSGQTPPNIFNVGGGGSYCAGTTPTGVSVTLSGSQINVTYQLKKNGQAIGAAINGTGSPLQWQNQNAGTYTVDASNGYLTSTMSGSALIVEMPLLPVSVTVQASANNICSGTMVNFAANPVNGGTNPTYQWKVNGANQGTNSPFFAYTPQNGDLVNVILTSNASCLSGNPATSNTMSMIVNPIPSVSWNNFEPDTLCIFWQPVQLSGGLPLGGVYSGPGVSNNMFAPAIAGLGNHTLTYTYTSQFNCIASVNLNVYVDHCTGLDPSVNNKVNVVVHPNPNNGSLTITFSDQNLTATGFTVYNTFGQILRSEARTLSTNAKINLEDLSKGVYVIQIHFGDYYTRTTFVIK